MLPVVINKRNVSKTKEVSSILEVCKSIGLKIPRFCYHETLSIARNCRMCLVEVGGFEKAVASCLTEVTEGMVIFIEPLKQFQFLSAILLYTEYMDFSITNEMISVLIFIFILVFISSLII